MSLLSRSLAGAAAAGLVVSLSAQGPTQNHWTSPPVPINALSSINYDASIATCLGGTQAWITSTRVGGPGGYDIYWASRANSTAPWSTPVVSALSTPGAEYFADVTEDGTEICFSYTAAAGGGISDLLIASRTNVLADFAANSAVPIAAVNTASDEGDPSFSADALELYFQSDRAGGQQNAIYRSTRATRAAAFGAGTLVSDTVNLDHSPAISGSGNYLYHSIFLGGNNSDYHGLYRANTSTAFSSPTVVTEWASPEWEANGQFERADSVFMLVSLNVAWGGLASSSVYESPRQVPGLIANVDSVSGATGGLINLTSGETPANPLGFHILFLAFGQIPATPVPGIVGELVINPSPLFQIGSGPTGPGDGLVGYTLGVPAGVPSGGVLHFQVLGIDLGTLALTLSTHESVRIL